MPKFRKRPLLVHAVQYANPSDCTKIHDFCGHTVPEDDALMCGGGAPIAITVCGIDLDLELGGWVVREPMLDGTHVCWPMTDAQFRRFHFAEQADEPDSYYAKMTPLDRAGFKVSALLSVAEERAESDLQAALSQILAWIDEATRADAGEVPAKTAVRPRGASQ